MKYPCIFQCYNIWHLYHRIKSEEIAPPPPQKKIKKIIIIQFSVLMKSDTSIKTFFQICLPRSDQWFWSSDDSKIISCGMDGAVYEWNAFSGKREGESVLKSCSYTSVTSTPDGKVTFAVGSDRTLKEISDSQVNHCTIISVAFMIKERYTLDEILYNLLIFLWKFKNYDDQCKHQQRGLPSSKMFLYCSVNFNAVLLMGNVEKIKISFIVFFIW